MESLAPKLGNDRRDYRDAIRARRKDQLVGDAILAHYQQRLGEIEAIVRREKLFTLPQRLARISRGQGRRTTRCE
ncbi:MAG: hypothetical protein ACRD96_08365 [Bryobacteraceae bacterium]